MNNFPEPGDLHVFATVVRKAGFSAAAEELGASPAYVSKRIRLLEATLATRLLHRTTRRVELTDAGRDFLARCRRLIDERDEALAASGGEGVMERVGREHDGLAHVPAVEVDDVLGRAAQVLHLMRPIVAA